MKKHLQHQKGVFVLLLLALFVGMGTANAYDFYKNCSTGQRLYYNIIDATNHYVELTYPGTFGEPWAGYTEPTGNITLPSTVTYNGINYTVTRIGEVAFADCTGLTGSLTIPNTVTTIGHGAFMGCTGFTGSLTIPNSVTSIGPHVFNGCTGFTGSLTIPNSVTQIGAYAFTWLSSLTGSLTLPNSITVIPEGAFEYCVNLSGNLSLPNSLTTIGYAAFLGCTSFTGSLTIPNSVTSIAGYAFYSCDGFNGTLTIGTGVTSIGVNAFKNCSGFTQVKYNAINCNDVNDEAKPFEGCIGTLTIGNGVQRIPACMFAYGGFTGTLSIPNSVTTIGEHAFYECEDFTGHLTIPSSVTSISNAAFFWCVNLTGLTLPNSVTTIGSQAFYKCSSFTGSLIIPNSVTEIGWDAFGHCTEFTSLTLGNSLTTIGVGAFVWCEFRGLLTIPPSVTTIEEAAFAHCTRFTLISVLPETPPTLGVNAFMGLSTDIPVMVPCNTLTAYQSASGWNAFTNMQEDCDPLIYSINPDGISVTVIGHADGTAATGELVIPEIKVIDGVAYAVTKIGDHAFSNCSGLTGSLTIPNSVTSIDNYAFNGCSGLTGSLTIPNSVISIGKCAFLNCSGFNGSLTLSNSVTSIGNHAFNNCSGLTGSLTIPNSVTTIGEHGFYKCTGLTGSLNLGSSLTFIGARAFFSCGFTGTLTLPNSLTTIGEWALAHNHFTGSLTIPDSVTEIDEGAFYDNDFTGTLAIGTSVSSIGERAFRSCYGFTTIYYNAANCADLTSTTKPFENCSSLLIGSAVARIPAYLFYGCSGFTGSLSIPNSVTEIGMSAFEGCEGFSGSLTLGNSMTTIGESAFYGCDGLTGSLTIPNSVVMIDTYAFGHCGFSDLTIGSSVSTLNHGAFFSCTILSSITVYAETPPVMGSLVPVFFDVQMDIPVYVPCASLEDYQSASGWSEFTNYICQPMTVTVTAVPTEGGTVSGGGTYSSGTTCTVMATPNSGYQFMHWSKSDGTVVSCNASYSFSVSESVELEAVFMPTSYFGAVIGSGEATNVYLPSYSYYKYALSQQIYTAAELGGSRTIASISFFNAGATKTRTYDIYLVHTSKTVFSNTTDWINVTSSSKVFSGTVTMRAGQWTPIVLDTPFSYNGTSNLALIVDDNSGNYTSAPHMSCRVFNANGNQAIRIYNDITNYNPSSASSYTGTLMTEKNQIMLNGTTYYISAQSYNTSMGTVSGTGHYIAGDLCTVKATAYQGYRFVYWMDSFGEIVSTDPHYTFNVTGDRILRAAFIANDDNLCNLTFELHDSYGDGWNDNALMVYSGNGLNYQITVPEDMSELTLVLPVGDGYPVELNWDEGGWPQECSFEVRYSNGNLVCVAGQHGELDENFTYEFDMDCDGMSTGWVYVGDHSRSTNYYLPSYSYYRYSLSEQIYTPEEIGMTGFINGIAFYNDGETKTRTYDIYMKTTEKTEFASQYDWISTSAAEKVFSGSVTMLSGTWTPIVFNSPFNYYGSSNLVLIVDDNTGSYTGSPYMACRVYTNEGLSTLRAFSDGTNFNPSSPSSYTGTLQTVKNQIMLDITYVDCSAPDELYATDVTENSATLNWTGDANSYNVRYRPISREYDFEDGSLGGWTTIDADGDGYNWAVNTSWGGHDGSTGMVNSASYDYEALLPDNYLVSPQIPLGGIISFWACAQDASWAGEHFGVAVSTTNNSNTSAFTTIKEWTMTAKGVGAPTDMTRSGNRSQGVWYQYTADLTAYAGQTGYVAIRHFNCTDMYYLNVDDIYIGASAQSSDWTMQTATGSSLNINGLAPGTIYEWQVQGFSANCENGLTHWSESVTFTTTALPTVTQSYMLAQGWNWWSTYVELEGVDGLAMLEEGLGENGTSIKSQDAFMDYSLQYGWSGTLSAIDNESGYKLNVVGACILAMSGPMAASVDHPITLSQGWNWIGYPISTAQNITTALSGFVPRAGDVLKGQDGYTTYNGSLGWTPSTFVLTPGESYMYYSTATSNKTLVFAQGRGEVLPANSEEYYWQADRHAYPDNLSVMAVVEVDGEEQRDEALELGAFVNGECRGSAKLYHVASLDRYIAFLTVTGQDGEQVEFRLLDESRATSVSGDRITFGSNAIVGSLDTPFLIHFGAMNGLAELQKNVNVYPNPVDRNTPFTLSIPEEETVAEVLVVNAMGEVVTKETGSLARCTMEGLPTAGVYMVKVTCKSGNVYISRVVVK